MSNEIYFSGFRLEHYTGWNGAGTPSYGTVSLTNTNNYNSVGDISLNSSSNILWGAINDTDYNPIYFMMCGGILPTFVTSTNTYNSYITDGTNILGFSISNNSSSTNMTLTIFDGTYDSNTNAVTQGNTIYTTSGSLAGYPICTSALYFKLSSNSGSSYDTLDVYYNSYGATSSSYPFSSPIKIVNSFSLNNFISHITGIFHTCSMSNTSGSLPSCICDVVANYDLSGGYLDWTTGSAIGSIANWIGDVSTFQTYPVSYGGYPQFTNGYTGSYTVSIPNYLALGSSLTLVFYAVDNSAVQIIFHGQISGGSYLYPIIAISDNVGSYLKYNSGYYQRSSYTNIQISNSIVYNSWNKITLYNNNGTITMTTNGKSTVVSKLDSETVFTLLCSPSIIYAGIAYTNSGTIPSYPFDQDSEVVSYIDFYDPNNPVVYGDQTQLSITSKSLTSGTTLTNVPSIKINSENDSKFVISSGGQYSYTPGTSVSYTQTKSLNYGTALDATMIISSPMITDGSASVSSFVYKNAYTNGYSGSYTVSVPNYLASGTGISIIVYVPETLTKIFGLTSTNNSKLYDTPSITLNEVPGDRYRYGNVSYYDYNGSVFNSDGTQTSIIVANTWNNISIFNNYGTYILNVNGNISNFTSLQNIKSIILSMDENCIVAGLAYTTSSTVNYPYNEDDNVTSYIDFADPNNPVVYGDQTQLSVTSKSLTSVTTLPNVPSIKINSENDVSNYYTGQDVLSLSTTGSAETFYFYNDPFTNKRWDTSSISSYQFGITKVS